MENKVFKDGTIFVIEGLCKRSCYYRLLKQSQWS